MRGSPERSRTGRIRSPPRIRTPPATVNSEPPGPAGRHRRHIRLRTSWGNRRFGRSSPRGLHRDPTPALPFPLRPSALLRGQILPPGSTRCAEEVDRRRLRDVTRLRAERRKDSCCDSLFANVAQRPLGSPLPGSRTASLHRLLHVLQGLVKIVRNVSDHPLPQPRTGPLLGLLRLLPYEFRDRTFVPGDDDFFARRQAVAQVGSGFVLANSLDPWPPSAQKRGNG